MKKIDELRQKMKRATDELSALHAEALKQTQAEVKSYRDKLSPSNYRKGLLAILDTYQPDNASLAPLTQFAMENLSPNYQTNGAVIVSTATKILKNFTEDKRRILLNCILAAVNGKIESGLIRWPANWQDNISTEGIELACKTLKPEAWAKYKAQTEADHSEHAALEIELAALLNYTKPKLPNKKKIPHIKNNHGGTICVNNVAFGQGAVTTVDKVTFSKLIASNRLTHYFKDKKLEIML